MRVLFFYPRWGSDDIPLEEFLTKVKTAGYDGVEIGMPEKESEFEMVLHLLTQFELKFILQHYETHTSDFSLHKLEYTERLERLAMNKPYLINSHTGRDFFTFDQNMELLKVARKISKKYDISITHETHRSRFSFAAHITAKYLDLEWIKLTWDVSHWFCVAETLLEDQEETITKTIPHVQHLHARIGHTQGPQVDNLYDEKWMATCERHLQLWDRVIQHHKNKGNKEISITTEFGPWPYMLHVPANVTAQFQQFKLNTEIKNLIKARLNHSLL